MEDDTNKQQVIEMLRRLNNLAIAKEKDKNLSQDGPDNITDTENEVREDLNLNATFGDVGTEPADSTENRLQQANLQASNDE